MRDFDLYSAAGMNAVEAVFWIIIGILLFAGSRKLASRYPKNDIIALATLFVAFGASDSFEVHSGAWWRPWWLLAWKTLNAIGLVFFVGKLYLAEKKNKRGN
jgi:hypothetical protein